MKISDLAEKYKELEIYEERNRTEDHEELVFYKKEMAEWEKIFEDMLGPALKPAGEKPSKEAATLTEPYGGIMAGQVLYFKEVDDGSIMVMIWPWQNDVHATLKVYFLRKGE